MRKHTPKIPSVSILRTVERQIESQLLPTIRAHYHRIVAAGEGARLGIKPDSHFAVINEHEDPIISCVRNGIGLAFLVRNETSDKPPLAAIIPAAMTLTLRGLARANQTGAVKIGRDELAQATNIFKDHLFTLLGLTPQMMDEVVRKVHGLIQDPASAERILQAAGACMPTEGGLH